MTSSILSWFGWGRKDNALHVNVPLPDKQILSKITHFTPSEITKLYKRYCLICGDDGLLDSRGFGLLPEIAAMPLALLAFEYEATEHMHQPELDFNQFCLLLSHFSSKAPIAEKVEYLFDIIKNNDGISSVQEADYIYFMTKLSRGTVPACTIIKGGISSSSDDERREEGEENGMTGNKLKLVSNGTIDEKKLAKFLCLHDVRALLTVHF